MARRSSNPGTVNLDQAIVSKTGGYFIPASQLNQLVDGVMQILRNNFKSMRDDLTTGQTRTKPQGLFDKFKNFLWGYENPRNPWYLANRLGALGHSSPKIEGVLHAYKTFNEWVERYNSLNITEARLVLDDMIRPHLQKLEDDIRDYIRNFVQPYYVLQPQFAPPKVQSAQQEPKQSERSQATAERPASGRPVSNSAEIGTPFEGEQIVTQQKPSKSTMSPKSPTKPKIPTEAELKAASKAIEKKLRGKSRIKPGDADTSLQTESVFKDLIKNKSLSHFAGSTLYERTLICLDRLREFKKD